VLCNKQDRTYILKKAFLSRATEIHSNKYDYSSVVYTKSYVKVKILCKKHSLVFKQTPNNHLEGKGCPECSKERVGRWGVNSVNRNKEDSLETSYYFYFIKLNELGDSIYKIGVTNCMKTRLKAHKRSVGKVQTIAVKHTNLYTAIHLEDFFKKLFSNCNYRPIESFGGYTEVFNFTKKEVEFINTFLDDVREDWYNYE
jgi:predicted GIY-YIG superfamily endonuclease